MREIIAFIGRAGSGKDYQASLLEKQGYKKLAFADILRQLSCQLLDMDYSYMEQNYNYLKTHNLYNNLTFRNIMQNLSDVIKKVNPAFFREYMCKIIDSPEYKNFNICISDMRYGLEYGCIAKLCQEKHYNFKAIFCDYHSQRYEENNNHNSAWLSNGLHDMGYQDLQKVDFKDVIVLMQKEHELNK